MSSSRAVVHRNADYEIETLSSVFPNFYAGMLNASCRVLIHPRNENEEETSMGERALQDVKNMLKDILQSNCPRYHNEVNEQAVFFVTHKGIKEGQQFQWEKYDGSFEQSIFDFEEEFYCM